MDKDIMKLLHEYISVKMRNVANADVETVALNLSVQQCQALLNALEVAGEM